MAEKNTDIARESAQASATNPLTGQPLPPAGRNKMKPLDEMRFHQQGYGQNVWEAIPPAGTTIENMLTREFWANMARKLRSMDKIVVLTDDRRLYAEFIVFAVGTTWAQVRLLGTPIVVDHLTARSSFADDYEISDGGLHRGWTVTRKSDGRLVKEDGTLKTEDAARAWLREYLQAQGLRTAA